VTVTSSKYTPPRLEPFPAGERQIGSGSQKTSGEVVISIFPMYTFFKSPGHANLPKTGCAPAQPAHTPFSEALIQESPP
jgi:hypothetical protein